MSAQLQDALLTRANESALLLQLVCMSAQSQEHLTMLCWPAAAGQHTSTAVGRCGRAAEPLMHTHGVLRALGPKAGHMR